MRTIKNIFTLYGKLDIKEQTYLWQIMLASKEVWNTRPEDARDFFTNIVKKFIKIKKTNDRRELTKSQIDIANKAYQCKPRRRQNAKTTWLKMNVLLIRQRLAEKKSLWAIWKELNNLAKKDGQTMETKANGKKEYVTYTGLRKFIKRELD